MGASLGNGTLSWIPTFQAKALSRAFTYGRRRKSLRWAGRFRPASSIARRSHPMTERPVDILDANRNTIHAHPMTPSAGSDADFMAKCLEAAVSGQLVPDDELARLTAGIHDSHEGRIAPGPSFGWRFPNEERAGAGGPRKGISSLGAARTVGSRSDGDWHRALEQHLPEWIYMLWQERVR